MNNKIKISYLKVGHNYQILDYNKNFIEFFGQQNEELSGMNLINIIPTPNPNVYSCINSLKSNESKTILLFKAYNSSSNAQDSVVIIYAIIKRVENDYIVLFVNWLNWINNLYDSLERNFNSIANLDDAEFKSKINYLAEPYWFKALLPLITYTPKNLISQVSSHILFKILRIFNNKRGVNHFSKDYNRDTISRIKNNIKKTTGVLLPDINMIVGNTSLIDIQRGNQIIIRETSLTEDILIFPERDEFLEALMLKLTARL